MGMKWAAKFCPIAKFVLKIDDDISLNAYELTNYLEEITLKFPHLENTMICKVIRQAHVRRDIKNKFYISKQDYPDDAYPTYCNGPSYLLTSDLARKLFIKSLHFKNFVFEDIHISSLALTLNASFVDINQYYNDITFLKNINVSSITTDQVEGFFFFRVIRIS